MAVAETLGPIFLANAVVIGLFHWLYVRSYRRRLAARRGRGLPGPYAVAPPSAPAIASAEAKSHD